ncbi:MAG: hypothetical protein JWQ09_3379 [Segetibacter sp.]|nr:hypothetical protein [Segetibacter sp.]
MYCVFYVSGTIATIELVARPNGQPDGHRMLVRLVQILHNSLYEKSFGFFQVESGLIYQCH